MSEIKTNRVEIRYSLDAIKRDFVILRLRFSAEGKKWRGARQLDSLTEDGVNAVSVVYVWGNDAYAMFKRSDVDVYQLIRDIRGKADFSDITVQEVEPAAYYNSDDEDKISGLFLARLMLNSLGASRSRLADYQYSNLTGTLLLVPFLKGNPKNSLEVARVNFERTDRGGSSFRLGVNIATYRKKIGILAENKSAFGKRKEELQKALKKPEYVYHPGRSCLRRWIEDERSDPKRTYIHCGFKGTHACRCFLDFGSVRKFGNSRAGILHKIMGDIDAELKEYMSVSFVRQPYHQTMDLSAGLMDSVSKIRRKLEAHKLHIVDRVGDADSKDLAEKLGEAFLDYLPSKDDLSFGTEDVPGALNFRIVHDALYYANAEQKDEYILSDEECQRQHLTVESTNQDALKPVVKTILKEQLIKHDIANKQLSVFEWDGLGLTGQWVFGHYEKDEPLRLMNIEADGRFDFTEVDTSGMGDFGVHQRYIDALDAQNIDSLWQRGLSIEGFVVSPEGDMNFIFRSEEISIPNLDQIKQLVEAVGDPLPEELKTGRALSSMIMEFVQEFDGDTQKAEAFSEELRKFGEENIPKNEFRKMLNEHVGKNTKETQAIRQFLGKKYEVRLIFPKTVENLQALFDSSLDVKYIGISDTLAYYCVGEKIPSIQYSFKNACHLRKIVAVNGSKLVFDQLLPSLNVDFVRTGQSTVVPFPFKYLREFAEQQKTKGNAESADAKTI